jgi:hypothetical protein
MSAVSGHVFRYEGKRRPVWRAKYRLPDGRQAQKTIGPAWTARGRPGMVRTGATVADANAVYLRYVELDCRRKPSKLRDYASIFRNYVLPHLGDVALEDLTADRVERWAAVELDPDRRLANRTREKTITVLHGCLERARKLHHLPVNRSPTSRSPALPCGPEINVFSPKEVLALVRAAGRGDLPHRRLHGPPGRAS